jgi:sec-independent protein translocase protein TatB
MFDIGWSELLVIGIVAIVVVGPKELPRVLRTFGQYAGKLKRTAAEFRRQFDEAMVESELEDMRKSFERTAREAEAGLKLPPAANKPVMLPKASSPQPAEPPGEPVALPGSPANPVTKRAAKPKPRSAKLETPGTKPAAAKRAAPAKPAKAKTKAEPAP